MTERSIFAAALDIPDPAERAAYLDRACNGDAALRAHIEGLLAAEGDLGSFLNRPAAVAPDATAAYVPITEGPGSVIGRYKILQQIGEGGFGSVYMAEQREPVKRRVALKIIKLGMDTREVVARFEAERQALALMDHPNIAKVLDAGATDTGRPFFVMELVKGVPITSFCDENHLPARDRLGLFAQVCQAVQHAHQKGVVHRDLKPSNVLVTLHDGKPVPKVIDFGVAKALNQELTERTLFTAYGHMIGTPQYMSPEQAEMSGLDIDTRSDVYSLGVLLYELLTGTTPLEVAAIRKAGYAEMQRLIKEQEAPKPSQRVSTLGERLSVVARDRACDPDRLGATLRGDLDWIVLKALEKERGRRYESASGFAADVQRYLASEPVEAHPPSAGYRVRKFVRRNRGPVVAAAAVFGVLCLGLAGTVAGMIVARNEADRAARAEAETAEQRDAALREATEKEKARQAEADQRAAADRERMAAVAAREELRRTFYAAQMNLANNAARDHHGQRVLDHLNVARPKPGETDLRGPEWHILYRQFNAEEKVVRLLGSARGFSFSPDGSRIVLAVVETKPGQQEPTRVLRICETATGRLVREIPLPPFDYGPKGKPSFPTSAPTSLFPTFLRNGALVACMDPGVVLLGFKGAYRVYVVDSGKLIEEESWDPKAGARVPDGMTPDGRIRADRKSDRPNVGDQRDDRRAEYTLLDVGSGAEVRKLTVDHLTVRLAFSPDSRLVAYRHPERGLVVEETGSGKEVMAVTGTNTLGLRREFAPNGKLLLSESAETATLWDVATGKPVLTLPGTGGKYAFSPDGTRLAILRGVSPNNGTTPPIDVVSLAPPYSTVQTIQYAGEIGGLTFGPDGKRLVAYFSSDGSVRHWELNSLRAAANASAPESVVSYNGDASRFLLASPLPGRTAQLRVVDRAGHELGRRELGRQINRSSFVTDQDVRRVAWAAVLPQPGQTTASGQPEVEVRVWDVETDREQVLGANWVWESAPGIPWVALSPDGSRLVVCLTEKTTDPGTGTRGSRRLARLLDTRAGKVLAESDELRGNGSPFGGRPAFQGDGTITLSVAAGGSRYARYVLDATTLKLLRTETALSPDPAPPARGRHTAAPVDEPRPQPPEWRPGPPGPLGEQTPPIAGVTVTDTATGASVGTFREPGFVVRGYFVVADGRVLVVEYLSRPEPGRASAYLAKVYDLPDGRERFALHATIRLGVADRELILSPDGRRLVVYDGGGDFNPGGFDPSATRAKARTREVKILDIDTGQELLSLDTPPLSGRCKVGFSADGRRLVVTGGAGVGGRPGDPAGVAFHVWDATPVPGAEGR